MSNEKELWRMFFEKELGEKEKSFNSSIESEYRCNNCGEYFYSDKEGVGYPTCPHCGSSDVWSF